MLIDAIQSVEDGCFKALAVSPVIRAGSAEVHRRLCFAKGHYPCAHHSLNASLPCVQIFSSARMLSLTARLRSITGFSSRNGWDDLGSPRSHGSHVALRSGPLCPRVLEEVSSQREQIPHQWCKPLRETRLHDEVVQDQGVTCNLYQSVHLVRPDICRVSLGKNLTIYKAPGITHDHAMAQGT